MFKRIFGKKDATSTLVPNIQAVCPHTVLVPSWDRVEDMGKEDKASRFTCESCHQEFSLVEAKGLRRGEASRLNEELPGGTEQTPN